MKTVYQFWKTNARRAKTALRSTVMVFVSIVILTVLTASIPGVKNVLMDFTSMFKENVWYYHLTVHSQISKQVTALSVRKALNWNHQENASKLSKYRTVKFMIQWIIKSVLCVSVDTILKVPNAKRFPPYVEITTHRQGSAWIARILVWASTRENAWM